MAKRRRGFDRGPSPARPVELGAGRRGVPRRVDRSAEAAAAVAARRRRTAVFATVGIAIGIAVIAFIGGAVGSPETSPTPSQPPASASASPTDNASVEPTPTIGGSGPLISGVACDVDEQVTYHVHSHLNIRFEGELQPVPAAIGILDTCLYWLHTHSNQGVIHVEAPAETSFTLGQFFDIWGETLSSAQVLGRAVGPGESLFVFVDRHRVEVDPRTIELGDLVAIELQIGAEPLDPLPYTFPPDLQ
jgi:hypothetical protein